jgi:hypothetical protein
LLLGSWTIGGILPAKPPQKLLAGYTDNQENPDYQRKHFLSGPLPVQALRLSLRPWQATCLQNYDTNSFAHKYNLHILKKLFINNQQKNNISTTLTFKNIVQQKCCN